MFTPSTQGPSYTIKDSSVSYTVSVLNLGPLRVSSDGRIGKTVNTFRTIFEKIVLFVTNTLLSRFLDLISK